MYIITNTTMGDEYTPSKAETLGEARAFVLETTISNIIAAWGTSDFFSQNEHKDANGNIITEANSFSELNDLDLVDSYRLFMKERHDITFSVYSSKVFYDDDSYNLMGIYDINKL